MWSFLMASAHGAGLMALPVVLAAGEGAAAVGLHGAHAAHAAPSSLTPWRGLAAVGVHTLAYLAATAGVAWLVYSKLGLALLRTAWLNLDWL